MIVSDFMLQLQQDLISKRKIAESTANLYLATLYNLNGKKSFSNLAWTKKTEAIESILESYADSTKITNYSVLVAALSLFADKAVYKKIFNYWTTKMMEAKSEMNKTQTENGTDKTNKQEENWIEWADIQKKKSELKEAISQFSSHKNITPSQYDKLLEYLVLSLYTDIPPRRNMDYLEMSIVRGETPDDSTNYYDLSNNKFIFNKYKTSKKYGAQTVDIPEDLQNTLSLYLKFHPLTKSKSKIFRFLVKQDGSPLSSINAITRILNKIFKKKVGSSMLRHIYLSSKYAGATEELKNDTAAMGNSPAVALREYIKTD